jgi:hypothetical protein
MNTTRRLAAMLAPGVVGYTSGLRGRFDAELALTPWGLVVAKRRVHPLACILLHMTVSEPQALEGDRPR